MSIRALVVELKYNKVLLMTGTQCLDIMELHMLVKAIKRGLHVLDVIVLAIIVTGCVTPWECYRTECRIYIGDVTNSLYQTQEGELIIIRPSTMEIYKPYVNSSSLGIWKMTQDTLTFIPMWKTINDSSTGEIAIVPLCPADSALDEYYRTYLIMDNDHMIDITRSKAYCLRQDSAYTIAARPIMNKLYRRMKSVNYVRYKPLTIMKPDSITNMNVDYR